MLVSLGTIHYSNVVSLISPPIEFEEVNEEFAGCFALVLNIQIKVLLCPDTVYVISLFQKLYLSFNTRMCHIVPVNARRDEFLLGCESLKIDNIFLGQHVDEQKQVDRETIEPFILAAIDSAVPTFEDECNLAESLVKHAVSANELAI